MDEKRVEREVRKQGAKEVERKVAGEKGQDKWKVYSIRRRGKGKDEKGEKWRGKNKWKWNYSEEVQLVQRVDMRIGKEDITGVLVMCQ